MEIIVRIEWRPRLMIKSRVRPKVTITIPQLKLYQPSSMIGKSKPD